MYATLFVKAPRGQQAFPGGSAVKNPSANAGGMGWADALEK